MNLKEQTVRDFEKSLQEALYGYMTQLGIRGGMYETYRKQREQLLQDRKAALYGDAAAKSRLLSLIRKFLEDREIWLCKPETDRERFVVLLAYYRQTYGKEGLGRVLSYVESGTVKGVYASHIPYLTPDVFREAAAGEIFGEVFGLGEAEVFLPFSPEGIHCGVSAPDRDGYACWILLEGKLTCLPYYCIPEEHLMKICKRLSFHCNGEGMTVHHGYTVGDRTDEMRVIVTRPPFGETWAFFLRRFDTFRHRLLTDLVTGPGSAHVIDFLKTALLTHRTMAVTGMQGSGKTTMLTALCGEIPESYTLRILEQVFELHLRKLYPHRNILTIRQTEAIDGQEGLDLLKKTDGCVTVVGEVASAKVASYMVEASKVASLFTLFTHHASSTDALLMWLRNSLLTEGGFHNETMALRQAVDAVRFDVHMARDPEGNRRIVRISEIVPVSGQACYEERVLFLLKDGEYVCVQPLSEQTMREMGEVWERGIRDRENPVFGSAGDSVCCA